MHTASQSGQSNLNAYLLKKMIVSISVWFEGKGDDTGAHHNEFHPTLQDARVTLNCEHWPWWDAAINEC